MRNVIPLEDIMVEHTYNDGHAHDWFSPLGAPERCALCGIGKSVHEDRLMEDGLKWRKYNLPQLLELLESKQYANDVLTVFQIWEALEIKLNELQSNSHNTKINSDRATITPSKLAKRLKKTGEKIILD